jgi:hypothetical protein
MGAIGMTYEQGGLGRAGLGVITDEGEELTLIDRLTHHTTTALSTVEMASQHTKRLNQEFQKFFDNSDLRYKSFALSGDADKLKRLQTLLDLHEIQYESPTGSKASGYNFLSKSQGSIELNDQSIVVHTAQPKGKMVKVLFEPDAKLADSLTYDITAWSLPYAYGLEAVASTSRIGSEVRFEENKEQEMLSDSYGYVSKWTSLEDARFLSSLLQAGFKVRFAQKTFGSDNQQFQPGSLIILRRDNKHKPKFVEELNQIAKKQNRALSTLTTGFSQLTPDMGSPDIELLNKPKVAVLSGDGTSSLSYGAIWHFFETELKYPLHVIHTDDLQRTDLSKYQVLIMPDGYYSRVIDESLRTKLGDWVSAGGRIIAISGALRSFAGKEGFGLSYKDSNDSNDPDPLIPYADRERAYANDLITGAIFKTEIDTSHPLGFGYTDHYFSLKLGSSAYDLLDDGYNVAYLNSSEVFSGFAGQNALSNLDRTLVFGETRKGRGSLIYMVDNPLFRSFWDNGKLFLVNSVFFVNQDAFK